MTDTINKVREHYSPAGLTDRIRAALTTIAVRVGEVREVASSHARGAE
jgi:hypothetical protein